MQWGITSGLTGGGTVAFPLAFKNAAIVTLGCSGPTGALPIVTGVSTIGFGLKVNLGPVQVMWHAIGT
jgi:hypothetical protein